MLSKAEQKMWAGKWIIKVSSFTIDTFKVGIFQKKKCTLAHKAYIFLTTQFIFNQKAWITLDL